MSKMSENIEMLSSQLGWNRKELQFLLNSVYPLEYNEDIDGQLLYILSNYKKENHKYTKKDMINIKNRFMKDVIETVGVENAESLLSFNLLKDTKYLKSVESELCASPELCRGWSKQYLMIQNFDDVVSSLDEDTAACYNFLIYVGDYHSEKENVESCCSLFRKPYSDSLLNSWIEFKNNVLLSTEKHKKLNEKTILRNAYLKVLYDYGKVSINTLSEIFNLESSTIKSIVKQPLLYNNCYYPFLLAGSKEHLKTYTALTDLLSAQKDNAEKVRNWLIQRIGGYWVKDMHIVPVFESAPLLTCPGTYIDAKDIAIIFKMNVDEVNKIVNSQEIIL